MTSNVSFKANNNRAIGVVFTLSIAQKFKYVALFNKLTILKLGAGMLKCA